MHCQTDSDNECHALMWLQHVYRHVFLIINDITYISGLKLKGFLFGVDYGVLLDVRICPRVANYLWKNKTA